MISLLIPTRNRHKQMIDFYLSATELALNPKELEFCWHIDDDDIDSYYMCKVMEHEGINSKFIVSKRGSVVQLHNPLFDICTGDIIMYSGDDIRFRTQAWDEKVVNAFKSTKDNIALVYGEDGYIPKNQRFATHGFLSRTWINIVGYVLPPYYNGSYADTWINRMADIIDRKRYVAVFNEHMHPAAGKAVVDSTMSEKFKQEANQLGINKNSVIYFEKFDEILEDAKKLYSYIQSYPKGIPIQDFNVKYGSGTLKFSGFRSK